MQIDHTMVELCLRAMARIGATEALSGTMRRIAAQHSTSTAETEVAFTVLTSDLMAAMLVQGDNVADIVNTVFAHRGSEWRLTRPNPRNPPAPGVG